MALKRRLSAPVVIVDHEIVKQINRIAHLVGVPQRNDEYDYSLLGEDKKFLGNVLDDIISSLEEPREMPRTGYLIEGNIPGTYVKADAIYSDDEGENEIAGAADAIRMWPELEEVPKDLSREAGKSIIQIEWRPTHRITYTLNKERL